jgi:lysophospholipase L1-like esterase
MNKQTKLMAIAISVVILISPIAVFKIINPQNSGFLPTASCSPVRVACVGDSITSVSGYPSDLQDMLGDNFTVGNFGSSGSTVSLNSWKPYMDQPEFESAEAFEPNIVVIMLGTNDDLMSLHQYNESFEGDYAQLISSFQGLQSKPDICIADSPPIFNDSVDLSPAYLTNTIVPKTNDLANRMNLSIIDVYDAFGSNSTYFEDGVHPNSQGAALIATEVYNALAYTYNLTQTP